MKFQNFLTSVLLLPFMALMGLLTGCGGGGGGGGAVVRTNLDPFVRWSAITPPATVKASGISQDGDYVAPGPSFAVTSTTDKGVSTDASASITYRSDNSISKISIETPNGTVVWDEALGDDIDDTDPALVTATNVALTSLALTVNAINAGWEYQTFGVWQTGIGTGSGSYGALSIGAPTAGSAIPTTSGAIFTGATMGFYADATGDGFVTVGELSVNADFAGRSLSFNANNTQKISTTTPFTSSSASNLDMTGTLTYAPATNSFSGTLNAVGGMTGTSQGRFYGPNAEELGGVFSLSRGAVETYTGSYGAMR